MLHNILPFLTPIAISAAAAALTAFLNSSQVKTAINAFSAKASLEASNLAVEGLHSRNAFVRVLVIQAMAYAEQHQATLLTQYADKAAYVLDVVSKDPRFAPLGVPLATVSHIIEDVFESVYQGAKHGVDGH